MFPMSEYGLRFSSRILKVRRCPMKIKSGLVAIVLGMGLALATALVLAGSNDQVTYAQSGTGVIRVATTGMDGPGCGSAASPCGTVQYAVDLAQQGDEIRVATGVYTRVQNVASLNTGAFTATQVVAVTKSLTIRGGYSTGNWTTPDADAKPTILDAEGLGRVLVVMGPITATIEGLSIINGNAAELGGGPSDYAAGGGVMVLDASVTISQCTIEGNAASTGAVWTDGYGGGLCLVNSSRSRLLGSVISGNTAARWGHGYGGGLRLENSPNTLLRGNVVTGNLGTQSSNGRAGGIHLLHSDNAVLEANLICNNTGSTGANYDGGGLYVQNSDYVRVTGNTFEGNVGGKGYSAGGGLFLADSDHAELSGNRIRGNVASTARGWGGGIYAGWCEDLTLAGNVLAGNAGTSNPAHLSWGGGIYITLGGPFTLVNNAIVDNQATTGGSGLYVEAASPALLHNTFARNTGGDGSAVYVTNQAEGYSTVTMTNSVIVSHTVGITVTAGNAAALVETLWHANGANWGGAGAVAHSSDHTGDPLFDDDGFHISKGSAAVDAGVEAGVTVDIDGEMRPMGLAPDLGADELPKVVIFLPVVLRGYGESQ
jgi:hypothetical protein